MSQSGNPRNNLGIMVKLARFRVGVAVVILSASGLPVPAVAAELKPETVKAFDRYVAVVDREIDRVIQSGMLGLDELTRGRAQVQRGSIIIEQYEEEVPVPGGLVTDWYGGMFIPDVTVDQVIQVMQDYGRHSEVFEEVVHSKLLGREDNAFRNYYRFEKRVAGLRIVLNTEHEIRYRKLAANRWFARGGSTRIAEVKNPDTRDEEELPVGNDTGFLWRMITYWLLEEADGGVYVELGTVSLSRDIPHGLGWLVRPYVQRIPRRTLENMLQQTRIVVKERVGE